MATSAAKPLLTDLVRGLDSVPSNYIRPISDRPNLNDVEFFDCNSIPLIDLQGLQGPNRSIIVEQIGRACLNYGFFQVKNHGVPDEAIDNMLNVSKQFFHLPERDRLKNYSDDPMKTTRLSTSFNVRTEKVSNWRDFLRIHCYPVVECIATENNYLRRCRRREDVAEYCKNVRELAVQLLEVISESLGLNKCHINGTLGEHAQHMAVNYYPPCPQPDLTYGLPGHTDPNAITILLQDQVPGLQVLRDGRWVAVNPIPYTFIVNIGDQIQVISNGRYKSVLHRAVVNDHEERMSIPTFYCPSPEAVIGPAPPLTGADNPPLYRNFAYSEYYQKFWNRWLATETCLDMFKKP